MNRPTEPDFDQRIADWLEDDPSLAPRQAMDTVLAAYPSIPQRRPIGMPRRLPTMTMPVRIAAAAAIGVLAVGGAFYLTRPDRPAVGGPSREPSASQIASAPANPSASPSLTVVPARAPAWTATGAMTEARSAQTATLLPDGKVLVAGGVIGPTASVSAASAELYDPIDGSWSATGNMLGARNGHTATLLADGTVLVVGGIRNIPGSPAAPTAEIYDPASGTWTATRDMLVPGRRHTATLLSDGKVLVVGGDSGPLVAELYDPGSGTWTETGRLATGRVGHTATLLPDGRVLVAGGESSGLDGASSAELYDPSSGSWTATGKTATPRAFQTATLLVDGRVLIAGGKGPHGAPIATAEIYDPISGSWTPTGSMVGVGIRGGCTTTLLPDGRVLAAGGDAGNGDSASARLYDPSSGIWTWALDMDTPRDGCTTTLLPSGRVLVAGGLRMIDGSLSPVASAELYDPGSP